MNKNELQKELALLLKRVVDLETKIEEMPDEVVGCMPMFEKPDVGQDYFGVTGDQLGFHYNWYDGEIDNRCFAIGNCFESKEIAERALQRKKLQFKEYQAAMKSWEDVGKELDWNNDEQCKYEINYRHKHGQTLINKRWNLHCDSPFASKEAAEKFINSLLTEDQRLLLTGEFYENN